MKKFVVISMILVFGLAGNILAGSAGIDVISQVIDLLENGPDFEITNNEASRLDPMTTVGNNLIFWNPDGVSLMASPDWAWDQELLVQLGVDKMHGQGHLWKPWLEEELPDREITEILASEMTHVIFNLLEIGDEIEGVTFEVSVKDYLGWSAVSVWREWEDSGDTIDDQPVAWIVFPN